jgi:hypothetical protein
MSSADRLTADNIRDRMIRGERFQWSEVLLWISSQDIELMGAAFQALTAVTPVVEGDIDEVACEVFLAEYCLRRMADDAGAPSAKIFEMPPYLAANALANWYRRMRTEGASKTHPTLQRVRVGLKHLYLSGDMKQKQRVVHGTLEHIFENPLCRSDFSDWSSEPELVGAVEAAKEWGEEHRQDDPDDEPVRS